MFEAWGMQIYEHLTRKCTGALQRLPFLDWLFGKIGACCVTNRRPFGSEWVEMKHKGEKDTFPWHYKKSQAKSEGISKSNFSL